MKVEKISENQIKLILTSADLKENNLKLEELIKPSDKTQDLFRGLMEKAFSQCGFEVDNTPLMVEATPISVDGLMIIVTKLPDKNSQKENMALMSQNKDLRRYKKKGVSALKNEPVSEENIIIYSFLCLDNAIDASVRIAGTFTGFSELYKYNRKYFLILQSDKKENDETMEFVLNEYGNRYASNVLTKYYLMEHGNVLIHNPAVKTIYDNFA